MQLLPKYTIVTGSNVDNIYADATTFEAAERHFKEALRLRPNTKIHLLKWTTQILKTGKEQK